MQQIIKLHRMYWQGSNYLVFYMLSIVILYFKRNEWKNGYNLYFIYSILIILLVIYNPIFIMIASKLFFSDFSAFLRVFYLLFSTGLISYTIIKLVFEQENKYKKLVLLVLIAGSVFMIGHSYLLNKGDYIKAENAYKIDDNALEIADFLLRDSEGKCVVYIQEDLWNIAYGIRQYTSKVKIGYPLVSKRKYIAGEFENEIKDFTDYMLLVRWKVKADYLICSNYDPLIHDITNCGYELVYSKDALAIMKYIVQ